MSDLRIPLATYRLQFNYRFTLNQALELVDYFNELGVSDLYASPLTKAIPGSVHGYDIVDTNELNPEIGTEEELGKLAEQLKQKNMGLMLDIVPNHMCVGAANKWWNDVLENGPSSLYANYFNILWNPPKVELKNKILLPVLDQQYGRVIENQDLKLIYEGGAFFVDYKGRRFPVNPRTWTVILEPVAKQLEGEWGPEHGDVLELQSILTALVHLPSISQRDPEKCRERNREKEIIKKRLSSLLEDHPAIFEAIQNSLQTLNGKKGDPHSFDQLEDLLKSQAYRLSFWRVTNDEINYRRFFDINELASMKVESEEVFASMHELWLELVKRGWVTGFRLDHIDGLFDPEQYFARLQQACYEIMHGECHQEVNRNYYLIVEKILIGNEQLRPQWSVFGTTGYDYLNHLNALFVVSESKEEIEQIYEEFTGRREEMVEIIYNCKKLILTFSMSSELHILARHLEEISEQHRWSRDFTMESLRYALRDIIACFPVYRTYIRPNDKQVSGEDKKYITHAIQEAKSVNPASDPSIFDFIQSVMLLEDPEGLNEEQIAYRRQFVMRFQQLTGPVTAKGVEDTALYRRFPLASLNEVGMDPEGFGISIEDFHQKNQERRERWPNTILATSTHDTKRNEDVRARINVISEDPKAWKQAIQRWKEYNRDKKTRLDRREIPDSNEEYLFYQTLVGTWPLYPMDAPARVQYIERINTYMNKAIREAKIHTSWININEVYEKGVKDFVEQTTSLDSSNLFLKDFAEFVQPIIRAGLFNSLSQTLLKMTTPGVPDFYQGSEIWEFALVDPDNRRPVDYSFRHSLLRSLMEKANKDLGSLYSHLVETPEDGRIKLYLIAQVLNFRRNHQALFQEGNYVPIRAQGSKADHIFAFSRTAGDQSIIVATGRFYTRLLDLRTASPIGESVWQDTSLPNVGLIGKYHNLLNGCEINLTQEQPLSIGHLFSELPLVLLYKTT